jgi:hypothetical protein
MPCEDLKDKVDALKDQIIMLQDELSVAPSNQKPLLAAKIKKLNQALAKAQADLKACYIEHEEGQLTATLSGTATLTTTEPNASGPFQKPVTIGLFFPIGREVVAIESVSPIVTDPFPTDLGMNTTTVTKVASWPGSSNPTYGTLALALRLKFDHSVDAPLYEEDSTLQLTLTTGKSEFGALHGSPINQSTGAVKLVGENIFQGGYLGGQKGRITITGTIHPIP